MTRIFYSTYKTKRIFLLNKTAIHQTKTINFKKFWFLKDDICDTSSKLNTDYKFIFE